MVYRSHDIYNFENYTYYNRLISPDPADEFQTFHVIIIVNSPVRIFSLGRNPEGCLTERYFLERNINIDNFNLTV